jgi:hypothetical protein
LKSLSLFLSVLVLDQVIVLEKSKEGLTGQRVILLVGPRLWSCVVLLGWGCAGGEPLLGPTLVGSLGVGRRNFWGTVGFLEGEGLCLQRVSFRLRHQQRHWDSGNQRKNCFQSRVEDGWKWRVLDCFSEHMFSSPAF